MSESNVSKKFEKFNSNWKITKTIETRIFSSKSIEKNQRSQKTNSKIQKQKQFVDGFF